jgi:hypothetical protein
MSIGIYKITNKINNKSYIGLSTDIERRFLDHKHRKDGRNKVLYRAFILYGIENFDFSIIELCSVEQLSEREKHWIAYYDTYNNGYNVTLGGEGTCKIDYELVIRDFAKTGSCIKTAHNLGITKHSVGRILSSHGVAHRSPQDCGGLNKKSVRQFTKHGEFLQEFISQRHAAEYLVSIGKTNATLDTIGAHIGQNCSGKIKSAYGFVWKYV